MKRAREKGKRKNARKRKNAWHAQSRRWGKIVVREAHVGQKGLWNDLYSGQRCRRWRQCSVGGSAGTVLSVKGEKSGREGARRQRANGGLIQERAAETTEFGWGVSIGEKDGKEGGDKGLEGAEDPRSTGGGDECGESGGERVTGRERGVRPCTETSMRATAAHNGAFGLSRAGRDGRAAADAQGPS